MKFTDMRSYDNKKRKALHSADEVVTLQPAPLLVSALATEDLPAVSTPIEFLNNISNDQALELEKIMISMNSYKYLINPAHVNTKIRPKEIISLTSETFQNGK
jgi:hypothetical protein